MITITPNQFTVINSNNLKLNARQHFQHFHSQNHSFSSFSITNLWAFPPEPIFTIFSIPINDLSPNLSPYSLPPTRTLPPSVNFSFFIFFLHLYKNQREQKSKTRTHMLRTTYSHPLDHLLHAITQTQLFTTNQPISHSTPNTRVPNQKRKTKRRGRRFEALNGSVVGWRWRGGAVKQAEAIGDGGGVARWSRRRRSGLRRPGVGLPWCSLVPNRDGPGTERRWRWRRWLADRDAKDAEANWFDVCVWSKRPSVWSKRPSRRGGGWRLRRRWVSPANKLRGGVVAGWADARPRGWSRVDGVGEEGGDADIAVFSREKWGERWWRRRWSLRWRSRWRDVRCRHWRRGVRWWEEEMHERRED